MQMQLKPWTGSERLYFYPQSAQIVGQTGQIGRLRIDFGRHGNEFYSTWEDSRQSLKSDMFRQQFDDIINDLRFDDGGRPLAGRKELTDFLRDKQAAILPEDGEWHGFRIDSDEYTALLRCKPSPGDYEAYVWCYKKDWLDVVNVRVFDWQKRISRRHFRKTLAFWGLVFFWQVRQLYIDNIQWILYNNCEKNLAKKNLRRSLFQHALRSR